MSQHPDNDSFSFTFIANYIPCMFGEGDPCQIDRGYYLPPNQTANPNLPILVERELSFFDIDQTYGR